MRALLTLAGAVTTIAALSLARETLLPVVLAILLSFLLAPLVTLLRRIWIPRMLAVLLSVVLALGLILAAGTVIASQVAGLAPEMAEYEATISLKLGSLQKGTFGEIDTWIENVSRRISPVPSQTQHPAQGPSQPGAPPAKAQPPAPPGSPANPLAVRVQAPPPSVLSLSEMVLRPLLGPLGTAVLVLILTVFMLSQREDLRDRMIAVFGASDLHRTTLAMDDAARRLSRYFLTQLGINAGFGLVIGSALALMGLPVPILWGVLAMLLRFIPYAGAPLAGLFPTLVAAAVFPGWSSALWVVALFAGCEAVTGQLIEPLAYGRSTGLSPLAIVLAALFWTWLWGPIGLILSTPLTLVLVVIGRHVERLSFLGVLLGDEPALTPVEGFYQRLLARDPHEAADQAELWVRERNFPAWCDEVALPVLCCAAVDVMRGVLDREHQLDFRNAMIEVIDTIAPEPAAPDEAAEALPEVLCIGGRLPLDEATAAVMAALLRDQNIPARTAPANQLTARDGPRGAGAARLVVAYGEATGSQAQLRALLRRLRAGSADLPITLLLIPDSGTPPPERDLRGVAAASGVGVVPSFAAALATCREERPRIAAVA